MTEIFQCTYAIDLVEPHNVSPVRFKAQGGSFPATKRLHRTFDFAIVKLYLKMYMQRAEEGRDQLVGLSNEDRHFYCNLRRCLLSNPFWIGHWKCMKHDTIQR